MKKIVLTGGGTGGHVIPHLGLLRFLKDYEIYYIGTCGIEKSIIEKIPSIKFIEIEAVKLDRTKKLKNLLLPFKLIKSISYCKKILKQIKPDVIFSKGGFVSVPVVIAGKKCKVPVISHESDLSMGLANKIIYRYCNCMCTSFEQTAKGLKKAVFTGPPIRQELFEGNRQIGYDKTKLNPKLETILFMGGSTGALKLNKIIYESLPLLTQKYNVIHIVGKNKGDKNITFKNYCQLEYIDNIQDIFAISDYVVSRAGSNAIFEITALKKPILLIPLPKGASRGDQVENAKLFESLGYAKVCSQEGLTKESLIENIDTLIKDKQVLISSLNKANFANGCQNIFEQIRKWTLK